MVWFIVDVAFVWFVIGLVWVLVGGSCCWLVNSVGVCVFFVFVMHCDVCYLGFVV